MTSSKRFFQATLVAVVASASTSHAATYYFTAEGGNNYWDNNSNWKTACSGGSGGAVPSAADDAVICASKTAVVRDTSAVARTVTNNGTAIEITPSSSADATLTLGSGSSDLSSAVGTFRLLQGSSGHIATLAFVSANHTITSGLIRGSQDTALINIAASKTLTLQGSVRSKLTITSGTSGKFINDGDVFADDSSGTLTVAPYELDDTADADWQTIDGGKLKFDSTINTLDSLEGNFFMLAGSGVSEMQINKAITTTGLLSLSNGNLKVNENFTAGSSGHPLDFKGGTIDVAAGKLFTHY